MLISDWSSDVCSSDLVSFEREHPSLDRPCAVFAPRAVPLRLQDAPAGARLGHDGLGRPLHEISDAGDAQAAIPVPDDQSDPDRERAFRLFGDRGLDHAAGCRLEEHTSELQSLMPISYAAFCLKKKNETVEYTSKLEQRT